MALNPPICPHLQDSPLSPGHLTARLGPCSVREGLGDGAAAVCFLLTAREGVGRERKPQDRAWQMYQRKPARALLIKHNEAWDHKIFHLIPGPHEGGADQLG